MAKRVKKSTEMVAQPTVIKVSRTVKGLGEEEAGSTDLPEIIEVKSFATQPAVVRFSYPVKLTKAYQSVGLTVGIDLPCYAEEVDDAIIVAQEKVVARVKELLPETKQVLDHLVEISRQ